MIAQFPTPYPDELLYSQICRYHIRSGNYCATFTVDDIYHHRTVHPDFLYLNAFTDDAMRWICKDTTLQEVIMTRTMFPVYGRFIPKDRRKKAFSMLCAMEGNWDNLLFAPIKRGDRFLRYCPMCAAEDRTAYGETYWHRNAQICKLNICPEHGCKLVDSSIRISSRTTPNFFDAQSIIPVDTEAVMCENAAEIQLAQYMDAVMRSPLDPDTDTPVGSFLHSKLGEKYCNRSGLVRDMEQLYADYAAYYDGVELMPEYMMQKTFNGYKWDYYNVCQLGMFLGITAQELAELPYEVKLYGQESLFDTLSEKYGVDRDTVRKIGLEVLRYSNQQARMKRKSGPRAAQWEKLDDEMLPKIKAFVDAFYQDTDRPRRLSVKLVERNLNLPQKQLSKLPKSYEYVQSRMMSMPEHWARSVIWAYYDMTASSTPMSRYKILKRLGMRSGDLERCLPYIKDKMVAAFLSTSDVSTKTEV